VRIVAAPSLTALLILTYSYNHSGGADDGVVSLSAFAYLYSELVQYHQGRVASISELERRLESSGYSVGLKVLELLAYRQREVSYTINECIYIHECCFWNSHVSPSFH